MAANNKQDSVEPNNPRNHPAAVTVLEDRLESVAFASCKGKEN